jgi:hypothetical protein
LDVQTLLVDILNYYFIAERTQAIRRRKENANVINFGQLYYLSGRYREKTTTDFSTLIVLDVIVRYRLIAERTKNRFNEEKEEHWNVIIIPTIRPLDLSSYRRTNQKSIKRRKKGEHSNVIIIPTIIYSCL